MIQEAKTPIDNNLEEDSEENLPFKYSISSYGADYPVDSLEDVWKVEVSQKSCKPSNHDTYHGNINESLRGFG